MKILVVEDEPKTGDYLKQGLIEAGFVTDLAREGWDGLELAKRALRPDDPRCDAARPSMAGRCWKACAGPERRCRCCF